ncbi:TIR domain-containing protein [Sphingomonas sp. RB56-2]|uniref:TIR domain-containing protein n=1 Tax=Sphingomonas brevis TaxID=2908206 RepID=A0ABT0SBH2_9SPHN|nr:TIR domain-containing protein [Sphingomonas brevis]MCL6741464.1 TIR domain-containing protein [Sphingomonas brevis]
MDPHAIEGAGPGEDYVFVSYCRSDERAATAIIDLLDRAGFHVWWDGLIPGGERFGTLISKALEGARAVVVLWSRQSVESAWVQDEASWARDRHRLVPLSLDGCEPPLGFRQFQCIDISRGGPKAGNPAMQRALRAITDIMGRDPVEVGPVSRLPRINRRSALAAGAAVAVVGGGFAAWRTLIAPGKADANSIAVLPFENLSGDPRQQYLSDGLAAELRSRLSRNSLLSVVGQASSNAFRDRDENAPAIARKLRVANVLDGNIRAAGGQLRIGVELIDGKSGFSKWSRTFDRPMANLLDLQSEVADAVGSALAAQLGSAGKEPTERSGGTTSVAAFDSYLRGKELFDSQRDEASDRAALGEFTNAIGHDPDYAAAHAARSRALAVIANQYAQAGERRRLYGQAVDEARLAIANAGQFPEGHAALGYALFYGMLDIGAADGPYRRALELGGGSAEVQSLCALYRARRRQFDQATAAIERAQALDPLNPSLFKTQGRIRFASGDYTGAIVAARRALELNPKLGGVHGDIGNAQLMLGQIDNAAREFGAEGVALLAIPGRAIVAIRRKDMAVAARELELLRREEGDNGLYQQAQILAQWGKRSEALDVLMHALSVGDSGLVYLASDPFLLSLHGDERFKSLLRQLHFV